MLQILSRWFVHSPFRFFSPNLAQCRDLIELYLASNLTDAINKPEQAIEIHSKPKKGSMQLIW